MGWEDIIFKEVTEQKKKNVGMGLLISYRLILIAAVAYLVFDHLDQKEFKDTYYTHEGRVDFLLALDSSRWVTQQNLNSNAAIQITNLNTDEGISKGDIKEIKGRLRMNQ